MLLIGTVYTVMLASKAFMYNAYNNGVTEILDTEILDKQGLFRLKEDFLQGMATQVAQTMKGTVVKVWFDADAGGYFCDLKIEEAPATTDVHGVPFDKADTVRPRQMVA